MGPGGGLVSCASGVGASQPVICCQTLFCRCSSGPGRPLKEKTGGGGGQSATPTETNVHGDALCFMVKTWARHKTTEESLNNGWRLAVVGGWGLGVVAVGGWWRLVASGGWRLAVGGSEGLSLTKKRILMERRGPDPVHTNSPPPPPRARLHTRARRTTYRGYQDHSAGDRFMRSSR